LTGFGWLTIFFVFDELDISIVPSAFCQVSLLLVIALNENTEIFDSFSSIILLDLGVMVLLDPFRGWERGETLRRSNSQATPQGLDQRSKNGISNYQRWCVEA